MGSNIPARGEKRKRFFGLPIFSRHKKLILISAIVIASAIIASGIYVYIQRAEKAQADVMQCNGDVNSPIYQQIADVLVPSRKAELAIVAKEILRMKNYPTDSNCLYALTQSAINQGDVLGARKYFDLLSKAHNSSTGFNPKFYLAPDALKQIEQQVVFLEQLAAARKGASN